MRLSIISGVSLDSMAMGMVISCGRKEDVTHLEIHQLLCLIETAREALSFNAGSMSEAFRVLDGCRLAV
jgi:hypothetical protein